ncbi:Sodium/sulfate symporter [Zychaea mexicana]|uniref:Sodium/sulfate symporter n=1 Tax=Zychaea mexicana TaxID=64656 RepID=UPI0022FE3D93|nr:Sodium/sulfate symporter [Zychaea mexicana]KAI9488128.1 Sodium/sulfate symporter [Zychaea mexicana]
MPSSHEAIDVLVPASTADDPDERTALLPTTSSANHSQSSSLCSITGSFNNTCCKKLSRSHFISLLPSLILGIVIWFGITPTPELSTTAIHLLAVFASCIFALITTKVEISMLVLTGLTVLALTQSFECEDQATGKYTECRLCGEVNPLTRDIFECKGAKESFKHSLEGFSSSVVWLIFAAFHLGKAVEVTQLGRRLSLLMIKFFGKRILGLAYAIVASELLLGPFVPSNTARGGGIILPVVSSIATTLGSTPSKDPQVGAFLMLVGSHSNLLSASMYLTGMAPNPIVLAKAKALFPQIHFGFLDWFIGGVVPGLTCAVCLPLILRWACGLKTKSGENKVTSDSIIKHAQTELDRLGPISCREWQLCFVLIMCLCLWISAGYTNLDATLVALIGIVALLQMGTITWKDVSSNTSAWDTLFWLGGFVTIAQQLSEAGASAYLGNKISNAIDDLRLPPVPALAVAYFLTTFMFSSLSAHTVAFVGTFLDAGRALGANPMILTVLLAFFGALGGCMTNFSTGTAAMYYAPGYVTRSRWFSIGLQLALFYIIIYLTLGMGWWKLLGWH